MMGTKSYNKRNLSFLTAAIVLLGGLTPFHNLTTANAAIPYAVGDVFAAIGSGQVKHFDSSGVLLETLDTTTDASTTGMCFDDFGNLFVTTFFSNVVSKFDNAGNLLAASHASGLNANPGSCIIDGTGNMYVGNADGTRDIYKFDSAGTQLDTFDVATIEEVERGSNWIDLAGDQCTMHYTSSFTTIKRFDVCTDTQLSDFAVGLGGTCFAHRITSDGGEIVACSGQAYKLDDTGAITQTYPHPAAFGGPCPFCLVALDLDPDGTSFWTADAETGQVYRIDIATGAVLTNFDAGSSVSGLAVFGELAVSQEICGDGIDNDGDEKTDENCELTSISINAVRLGEGDSGTENFDFTVTRSGDLSGISTVDFATSPPDEDTAKPFTDYTAIPLTTLSFPADETSMTITVVVNGDTEIEVDETFSVLLSNCVNCAITQNNRNNQGLATIVNDDFDGPPPSTTISINDVSLTEGDSGTKNFDFTVTRSGDLSSTSTVDFATSPPDEDTAKPFTDYTAIPLTSLSFAADETTKTITVAVNGDTEIEVDETFSVLLSNCVNCAITQNNRNNQGLATIVNDDFDGPPPSTTISINDVSLTEGDSGTKNFDFTVTRSGDLSSTSTVDFATSPPDEDTAKPFTDYTAIPLTTLSFPADETSMTITVVVNGDTEIEVDETFSVLLSNCGDCGITDTQGLGTIENDDFVSEGTATLAPEKDSFIRSSATDTNAGANEVLILQKSGDKKALVSFDLSPLESQQISDAKLKLFVTYNGGNWGDGRTISAHKLLSDWDEGNGIDSVPIAIDPSVVKQRATGFSGLEGVTWACATDFNINNTQADCDSKWNGGSFESTASDLVFITSTTEGVWIEFDVTEDLNSFLNDGPSDNFGWLIKKTKQSEIGQIAFASKESSELDQRPQLVLTFE